MTRQMQKGFNWWLTCGVVVGGIVILGVLAGIYWFIPAGGSVPSVQILQPAQGLEIESGQVVVLVARGESSNGIQRIDFLVDDIPVNQQISGKAQQESLEAVFPWSGTKLGSTTLTVIAYDRAGRPSPPAHIQVEVTAATPGFTNAPNTEDGTQSPEEGVNGSGSGTPGGVVNLPNPLGEEAPEDGEQAIDEQDLPAGNDLPPTVTLNTPFERLGEQIILSINVEAADDIGLAYLEIFGQGSAPGNVFHYIEPSDGELRLSYQHTEQLSLGEWTITAQAFDNAGQASELVLRTIIVAPDDNGGLPNIALSNIAMESVASLILQEWEMLNVWQGLPMDARALLDFLYPENVISQQEDGGCLVFTAGEVAEGIGLSLEANCRYQPPPGNYILLKTKQITGSFGQASRWETVDWNDTPRTSLEPGDTIEVVDRNIACETQYTYSLEVGYSPYHREWLEYRPMSDEMIVTLTTAPCSNDSIGQALYLNAEQLQDGIRIEWGFREGGNWADQFQLLPEHEAVEMRLVRFLPERNIQDYIGIGRWTAAPQDLPGANFVVIDEDISLFCEEPIHYALFVQDLGIMLIPQHVYAQKSVSAPPIPCTGGFRIRDLEINVRPVWHHSNTLRGDRNVLHASVGSSFFGFDWPSEAANLHLVVSNFEDNQPIQLNRVLTLRAASDRLELPHNSSFSETLGPEASIACGGKEYAFFFEFEITEGFFSVLADRGRTFRWTSPPCPPRPPTLENLRAMSDCIESSTGSCIVANWSPPIYQDDWRMPLEQYLVISPNGVNFVPSSQTSFTYELNKLDPRSPGFTAAFLVYGCSAEGICGPPSQMLNIHIPGTPDTWDFWSFDYDSSR